MNTTLVVAPSEEKNWEKKINRLFLKELIPFNANANVEVLLASEVLEVDPNILRVAVLDDAGRVLSYAESEVGRTENLPKDSSLMINVLVRSNLLDALPKELGKVKFNVVVTDKYRLIGLVIGLNTLMFALPLNSMPDEICAKVLKRFST